MSWSPKTRLECVPEDSIMVPKPKSRTTKHKRTKPESELAPPTLCFKSSYPRRDVSSYQALLKEPNATSSTTNSTNNHNHDEKNLQQQQQKVLMSSQREQESSVVDIGELIEADIDDDDMIVFATFLNTLDTRDMVLRANSLINHSRKQSGKHVRRKSQ
ncbi:uncharacterized protein SAPINGB_P001516 [Magnusiomyces paraingens]|uniref:Uncharacterized protein n=1 Tax=Magnusiomyces paraingens TaxID=2606893 RepID=A0A5E8B6D0_9ASCO|nr:uncharacterized protein SAPINGB_P001516 [Saprochaete ingens]VVT47045.1 unnamed protein product [Saprochaete ingens]